jgi:glutathione S-transferase
MNCWILSLVAAGIWQQGYVSADPPYKLTYFHAPGRAWAIRACFKLASVDFVDEFITWEDLIAQRGSEGYSDSIPLGQVPLLTLPDGRLVTQSSAICRFAAKLAQLYPSDPISALLCDEIVETVNECMAKAPQNSDRDVKRLLREEWASKDLMKYLSFFAKKLSSVSSSPYVCDGELTIADFYLYSLLKMISNGSWDFISPELIKRFPVFDNYLNFLESDARFSEFKL